MTKGWSEGWFTCPLCIGSQGHWDDILDMWVSCELCGGAGGWEDYD